MNIRERIEENERVLLAPRAVRSSESKGRQVPEEPHALRTCFQRDRDRILHSKAFRRLAHKTQVFPAPDGDHYRVRLTHSLEVSQVARTIARALRLNEDLTEAICLGHDLGHTPFGHLGEESLSSFLGRPFRHNEQSLRVVDLLETRGPDENGAQRRGLNLTWEVRDGILNHTWSMPLPSTLEAQVARFADRIAYLSHDIDDAIRAGVLDVRDLPPETNRVLGITSSARIDTMVNAVVEASDGANHIAMSSEVFEVMATTRQFMFDRVYNRLGMSSGHQAVKNLILELVGYYKEHPDDLPTGGAGSDLESRLVDYIAGMTDRFAIRDHRRLLAT
ncbi:MAG: deoxyguanosinetriphosphate triphosphohydrolase, partial [Actinomycetota bacterium]|nr:deoxyguanosinetriphosphate triphosphohydrolase [Actinomycetota bacterium]